MAASTLPSGPELLVIITGGILIWGAIALWQRFGPKNQTLHNLLSGLNPGLARLIAADYAEQVLSAGTDEGSMQLARLGIATARAFALGKATIDELRAVRRVLSRASGVDFTKVAGQVGTAAVLMGAEPDLSSLARRLGSFELPADFVGETAISYAQERLQVSLPRRVASTLVVKAAACACADEPDPFDAARYARGAWKNKQTSQSMPGVSLGTALPVANVLWSTRAGRAAIAGVRAGAGLIDSQIDLARDYTSNGPKIVASLMQHAN
jgi:hypothetical protein